MLHVQKCALCVHTTNFFCLKVTPINMFSFDIIIISILFLFAKIFSLKFWGGLNLTIEPPLICESYKKIKISTLYDSRIKGGAEGKIVPPPISSSFFSKTKKAVEMIVTPNENILIYFSLRQKNFVTCTHKAHFWTCEKIYEFQQKSLIFPAKLRRLKNCVCINVAQKNYMERNFVYILENL